jgi:hypothetical protein
MSKTAAIDPNSTPEILRRLASNKTYHELLANNVSCPPDVLQKLASSDSLKVRQAVAAHPQTPIEALSRLSNDERVSVCIAVGTNPSTPRSVLENISEDRLEAIIRQELHDDTLLKELLTLPNVSEILLNRFAKHANQIVRVSVASNPKSSTELLEGLSLDEAFEVRWACARSARASGAMLERLSADSVWGVRWMVAQNPNTPSAALHQLLLDSAQEVVQAADQNLKKRER